MKLAGTTIVYNGLIHDYNFIEAIESLLTFCDHVFVVDCCSDDGTTEKLQDEFGDLDTVTIIHTLEKLTDEIPCMATKEPKERLNYFTNIAIEAAERAGYEYQFYLQADEAVTENSIKYIFAAIHSGYEGFLVKRINLWESPYMMLNVPHERKPVSTEIVRLTKTKYRAYGDAESIAAPAETVYLADIQIIHYGFVRKKEVMKAKIIHMQEKVFGVGHDKKLDGMDVFDSTAWFSGHDLVPLSYNHPPCMEEWVLERS